MKINQLQKSQITTFGEKPEVLSERDLWLEQKKDFGENEYGVQMRNADDAGTDRFLYPMTKLDNVLDGTKSLTDILSGLGYDPEGGGSVTPPTPGRDGKIYGVSKDITAIYCSFHNILIF